MGLPAYTYAGEGVGLIEIYANGQMRAFGAVATDYTSLAGMSFPVRSVRFRNLSLVNGWISVSSVPGKQAGVGLQNGIVYLAGGIARSSGTSSQFATLPPAFRPAHNLWLPVHTFLGKTGAIEIARTGQMYAFGGDAIAYSGLSGISFPLNS